MSRDYKLYLEDILEALAPLPTVYHCWWVTASASESHTTQLDSNAGRQRNWEPLLRPAH